MILTDGKVEWGAKSKSTLLPAGSLARTLEATKLTLQTETRASRSAGEAEKEEGGGRGEDSRVSKI